MGKIGISWYKPYKSPEDFFAQKVHDYNDIMRLTNADPEKLLKYILIAFSTFTVWHNNRLYLFPKYFHYPQGEPQSH